MEEIIKEKEDNGEILVEVDGVVFAGIQAIVVQELLDRLQKAEYERFYGKETYSVS